MDEERVILDSYDTLKNQFEGLKEAVEIGNNSGTQRFLQALGYGLSIEDKKNAILKFKQEWPDGRMKVRLQTKTGYSMKYAAGIPHRAPHPSK